MRFLFTFIFLLFVSGHSLAGVRIPLPKTKSPSVGHMTKQPNYSATRAANGDYNVTYRATQPFTAAAANDSSFAANVAVNVAKQKVVDIIVNGAKKGKITPAQVAAGVIGTLLLDELIDQGMQWMADTQQWLKTPLDDGSTYVWETGHCDGMTASQCAAWWKSINSSITVAYDFANMTVKQCFTIENSCVTYKLTKRSQGNAQPYVPSDVEWDAAATRIADTATNPSELLQEVTKIDPIALPGNTAQTVTITNPNQLTNPADAGTVTVTNPDGSTSITKTTTQTKTAVDPATQVTTIDNPWINANQDKLTSSTTTTTNPDGSTSTSTKTDTKPESDSDEEADTTPPVDPGTELPDIPDFELPEVKPPGFSVRLPTIPTSFSCSNPTFAMTLLTTSLSFPLPLCDWIEKFRGLFEWFWSVMTAISIYLMVRNMNVKTGDAK